MAQEQSIMAPSISGIFVDKLYDVIKFICSPYKGDNAIVYKKINCTIVICRKTGVTETNEDIKNVCNKYAMFCGTNLEIINTINLSDYCLGDSSFYCVETKEEDIYIDNNIIDTTYYKYLKPAFYEGLMDNFISNKYSHGVEGHIYNYVDGFVTNSVYIDKNIMINTCNKCKYSEANLKKSVFRFGCVKINKYYYDGDICSRKYTFDELTYIEYYDESGKCIREEIYENKKLLRGTTFILSTL